MKIITFIDAHHPELIRTILEHCGLWHDLPSGSPPKTLPSSRPVRSSLEPVSVPGITRAVDPDLLEYLRREELDQPEPPWQP